MKKITVTSYIDYRVFLRDYYAQEKAHTRHFSYRYFANKAGISSSSFLLRVMEGNRNLTRPMIDKFSLALKLSAKEKTYFTSLVLFNQAKTASEKNEHYGALRSMKGVIKETVLQGQQYDYFTNWYTPVVRELVCLYPFKNEFSKLGKAIIPPISAKEAREAVTLLVDLELIRKKKDGTYSQTNRSVAADSQIQHLAVKAYTNAMIEHSLKALHGMDKSVRHISTMTLGVSAQQYATLIAELEAFKSRIKQIVTEKENASQVYELNFALFPVSQNMNLNENTENE